MHSDLVLQQRVIDALEFEPSVNAAHIGVAVRDGVVTLSGHVDSYFEKKEAERTTRRVKGVTAVALHLNVVLPSDHQTEDDQIAARAVQLLHWDVMVPRDAVSVSVEDGIVTLNGEVAWQYQRAEAESDVRKLSGVKAVVNTISVRPKVNPDDIHLRIRQALERHAEIEADNVAIQVENGKVLLSGAVHAAAERRAIERAAWSAPGVVDVVDNIALTR
ncbi:MAG TPA: BON domain-containing protein [Alphaproteobacteria bacterium]|jgi:osmotically-inducible protein OsmY|nr:BON domain-containing protein [Alphaproteobacteria bacterium]